MGIPSNWLKSALSHQRGDGREASHSVDTDRGIIATFYNVIELLDRKNTQELSSCILFVGAVRVRCLS